MNRLLATATVPVADPDPLIAAVCEHLVEHEAQVERDGAAHVVTFPFGKGTLRAEEGRIELGAESADLSGLYYMRMALAGHIKHFARPQAPEVTWIGDGSDLVTPPNFRPAQVRAVSGITPHMRRITFVGADLGLFEAYGSLQLALIIPPNDGELVWPTIGRDGLLSWAEDKPRPALRRYTVRRCDLSTGEIDIDFVVHDDPGPGADFALRAKEGDWIGLFAPFGGAIRDDRDWYLIGGDETALPAIARTLESFPARKCGVALIEVAGPEEEQPIANRTGIEIRWLHRDGAEPGSVLAEAIRQIALPEDGGSCFVWTACEFDGFKSIRAHLRKERGLTREQHLAMAYWRKGQGEAEGDEG
ncbi:siderophore-interacting protein [Consotaella salsifontis]|uniref:NADPH-dependent ferric siderophore reductase, contains FAD-binding and SIP domains n=1 Tax=Consotaella salsifontis TaxID=1365950 RepID=A0A1T4TF75_9HYPH|nr:siderophore-interacting protein [Consotaella salsifontis]SKA39092.1 NADPH-dependent ferric siderophore reductase, contains FAD-binding and SIP domains [Consotaella salsifontis]